MDSKRSRPLANCVVNTVFSNEHMVGGQPISRDKGKSEEAKRESAGLGRADFFADWDDSLFKVLATFPYLHGRGPWGRFIKSNT